MGRIFEVRKHAMFARWNRMAKQFARIGKDITIAVKSGGTDPNSNSHLRRVIQNARAVNMPKDKVESAISRASGKEAANYDVVMYEGYAPHGVAVLVETATDNPTRTVASVRNAFSKHGGNLATTQQRQLHVQEDGRVPPEPRRHRPGRPRAVPDRSRPRGDGREHRRERRAADRDPLHVRRLRPPAEGAGGPQASRRCQPSTSTSASRRPSCPRRRRRR